jgi:acetoin utilization protein AcuB
MLMPSISRYMTRAPYVLAPKDKVSTARSVMREHGVHHLPVLDRNAKLVGIVSDRDLFGVSEDLVRDAMNVDVAAVDVNASLDEVIALMQTGRITSVVVTGAQGVEGIFTATDAVRALGDVLTRADQGER